MTETTSSLIQILQQLVTAPEQVVQAVTQRRFSTGKAVGLALIFSILTSLLFAWTTVLHQPNETTPWTPQELQLRFAFAFGMSAVGFLPILILVWGVLQRFSAWYWDSSAFTLLQALLLSGLGVGYYALALLIGIPIIAFSGPLGWLTDIFLFTLNIGAFLLSIRLFYSAYRQPGNLTRKKCVFISIFPLFIIALTYSATQLLTYFAMMPYLRGAGH